MLTGQSVTVYQAGSGRQILTVVCNPIERAGQNFALAPDGMSLAVIRDGNVEVYGLPPLSKKDETALHLALTSAQPLNILPVRITTPLSTSRAAVTASAAPAAALDASSPAAASARVPESTAASATPPETPAAATQPAAASNPDAAPSPAAAAAQTSAPVAAAVPLDNTITPARAG